MERQTLLQIPFAFILAVAVIFAGCDGPMGTQSGSGTGTLEVLLHDNPAGYDEVNVFIESVEVNNTETDTGWVEISSPQQSYDLLELTNGAMAVLGSKELEAGTYEQIRLILSRTGNSVVIDTTEHDLFIPSGAQTGIKINVNAEIKEGITYTMMLDFDASRSVVKRGNSHAADRAGASYLLKPVISASNQAETGNIAGMLEPADIESFVHAIANSDTISSTKADTSDGSFKLIGLEEGTYTVSVDPVDDSWAIADTSGIDVTVGETHDIGTIGLTQN